MIVDLNYSIKYFIFHLKSFTKCISLIENIFISSKNMESCIETRKIKYAILKVCFQSHVNIRKCDLPCGVLLNC